MVENAILTVPGFEKVYKTLQTQVVLKGQSKSTLQNYIRRIAGISLHFGKLPEQIDDDDINQYLTSLALDPGRHREVISNIWYMACGTITV